MLKTLMLATSVLALGATGALSAGMLKQTKVYYPPQQVQPMNEQGQAIMPPLNYDSMRGSGSTYIVDEYGRHYNERGDRIR
jgi:hypothetical protein